MDRRYFSIIIVLFWASMVNAKTVQVFSVDHTYYDVVAAVERLVNEPRTTPFKVPNLPVLIEGKDVSVDAHFRPSQRYYKVIIKLEKPIGKLCRFDKTLEVWGQPDKYVIRSTVDIGWQNFRCSLLNKIKDKIVQRAECKVLAQEKNKIMDYSARVGTPKVEQPISWVSIMSDTFDLFTKIMIKMDAK